MTNRMEESLEEFEKRINSIEFQNKHIILILNKQDIFKNKIEKKNLKNYFKNFQGKEFDEKDSIEFIKNLYLSKIKLKNDDKIHVFITNAMNQNEIELISKESIKFLLK